jgi:D-arabinose 1-dehydrogenase-like Zn-dependent alcohol dehydrogenase
VLGRLGSINTAVVALAAAAGITIWTSEVPAGERPERYDAVLDAGVDEAEWSHALRLLRPGGALICAGYRSGRTSTGYAIGSLEQLIFGERRVVGCAMGTREDLLALLAFLDRTGLRPPVGLAVPLGEAGKAFRALLDGTVAGKIVLTAPDSG